MGESSSTRPAEGLLIAVMRSPAFSPTAEIPGGWLLECVQVSAVCRVIVPCGAGGDLRPQVHPL